jgi:hypothetical protein
MKAVKGYTIETVAYRFELTIFRKSRRNPRFVGKFIGSAKLAKMPKQMFVEGKLTGFYLEKLVAQCRAAIDRIDGPILQMAPRKVLRRPGAESAGNSATQ